MNVKKLARLALLTAIALIIFIVEMRIPNLVPIPGVKLGLANIVTVYAMYHYSAKETSLIVLARILLGSISEEISAQLFTASAVHFSV